jgi:hypothetical protein
VLPLKTLSFFVVAHIFANNTDHGGWKYAMKVDDDSYPNVRKIHKQIQELDEKDSHFIGSVNTRAINPDRAPGHKWSVSFEMYPEPYFPLYPVGAGYGVSKFVKDAFEGGHFLNSRSMAFEDVAIGMLAERTGFYPPTHIKGFVRDGMGRKYKKSKEECMQDSSVAMHACFNETGLGTIDSNFMIQHHIDVIDFKIIHQKMVVQLANFTAAETER